MSDTPNPSQGATNPSPVPDALATPAPEQGVPAPAKQQPSSEPAPATAKQASDGKPSSEQKPEEGIKAPEGLNPKVLSTYTSVAKELGIATKDAQTLLDKLLPVMQQGHTEALETVQREWGEALKADPEIGGAKLDASIAAARKAVETFGGAELQELLQVTGLQSHPAVVRAFYRAGKSISEDSVVPGEKTPGGKPKDLAHLMFPNLK